MSTRDIDCWGFREIWDVFSSDVSCKTTYAVLKTEVWNAQGICGSDEGVEMTVSMSVWEKQTEDQTCPGRCPTQRIQARNDKVSLRQVERCWGRMKWLAGIYHNPNPRGMIKEEGETGRVTTRLISVTLQQSGTKATLGEKASHMKDRRVI